MSTSKKADPVKPRRASGSGLGHGAKPVGAPFPVVGVGASAGGLTAFEAFFSGMQAAENPGMAFVLVQHLLPDHDSMLSELIQRCTRMPVVEAQPS